MFLSRKPANRNSRAGCSVTTVLCNRYIAYARQYCAPRLSNEAKALLQEHYLKLRQQSAMLDGTPVTVTGLTPAAWCRSACRLRTAAVLHVSDSAMADGTLACVIPCCTHLKGTQRMLVRR